MRFPFPSAWCAAQLTRREVCSSASSPELALDGCHRNHDREQPHPHTARPPRPAATDRSRPCGPALGECLRMASVGVPSLTFGAWQALLVARAQVPAVPQVQGWPCDSKVTRTLERGLLVGPQCWSGEGLPVLLVGVQGASPSGAGLVGLVPSLQGLSVPGRTLAPQVGRLTEVGPCWGGHGGV